MLRLFKYSDSDLEEQDLKKIMNLLVTFIVYFDPGPVCLIKNVASYDALIPLPIRSSFQFKKAWNRLSREKFCIPSQTYFMTKLNIRFSYKLVEK